jgi:hypothetical protein
VISTEVVGCGAKFATNLPINGFDGLCVHANIGVSGIITVHDRACDIARRTI